MKQRPDSKRKRRPFWERSVEVIRQIKNRSFQTTDGRWLVVSGSWAGDTSQSWSQASHGNIRRLLLDCGGLETGVRVRKLDETTAQLVKNFCRTLGITYVKNRVVYEVIGRRLDEINSGLLSQMPMLCTRKPLQLGLHLEGEAEVPLGENVWYHEPPGADGE